MRLERMLGHVPALIHPNPKSVLIVGVGAGVTAGCALHSSGGRTHRHLRDRAVGARARAPYFGKENHHVFNDPRVQIVFDDARHFLQTTNEKFDIITSDPIHPWVHGAPRCTRRILRCAEHLTPGGVVTQWIPLYEPTSVGEERDRHLR